MSNINIFQIAYSKETLLKIEEGYKILDNLDNLRPDWYEYWPIRNYLKSNLTANNYYGFLSPKFKSKTGLSFKQVYDFIADHQDQNDIFIFSPQFDMGAFFLNIIEQGETFDPGFYSTFNSFLNTFDNNIKIENLVMDSTNIVFSNYFIASSEFWSEWLRICEKLFEIAEDQKSELSKFICFPTNYGNNVQRKVFMIERIASLILSNSNMWKIKIKNPINMAWSSLPTNKFMNEAILSDALKISYNQTKNIFYLEEFLNIRKNVFYKK